MNATKNVEIVAECDVAEFFVRGVLADLPQRDLKAVKMVVARDFRAEDMRRALGKDANKIAGRAFPDERAVFVDTNVPATRFEPTLLHEIGHLVGHTFHRREHDRDPERWADAYRDKILKGSLESETKEKIGGAS